MRIIELAVENVKRIKAVELKPVGDVVVISGKNGAGKTSVLDSIEWLFAGAKHIQSVPIRKGERSAKIKASIGGKEIEFVVTRTMRDGKPSELTVTTAAGFTPPGGAQSVLDAFLGSLSFDPLAFERMKPAEQVAELLRVFPLGVDLEELDGLNRTDYAKRTDVNRDAKAARVKAAGIIVAPDLPAEPIDESALLDRIQAAADGNAQIEQRNTRRAETEGQARGKRQAAQNLRDAAAAMRKEADRMDAEAAAVDAEANALHKKLADAPPLPDPVDIATIRVELDAAKATNKALAARQERERLEAEASALAEQAAALSRAMEDRERAKRDAVAAAKFPVPGLGFGDGIVTLDGMPLDQASAAQVLQLSVAIGMAANPKLRVILVRDGSLLDEDSRAQIAAMAHDNDYQLWLEVAGKGEATGFVIEDGGATVAAVDAASTKEGASK